MSLFWSLGGPYHESMSVASAQASSDARRATSAAREIKREMAELEERVSRLAMTCAAMWSLIQEKTSLTEQDLMQRAAELDATDGKLDGKNSQGVAQCASCGRPMSPRHQTCMYCGKPRPTNSAFDSTM